LQNNFSIDASIKKLLFQVGGGCTPIPRKPAWVREGDRLKGFHPQAQKIILCSMHRTQNYFWSHPQTRSNKTKTNPNQNLWMCVCVQRKNDTALEANDNPDNQSPFNPQANRNTGTQSCECVSVLWPARALNGD
jgi:hypothetical protein